MSVPALILDPDFCARPLVPSIYCSEVHAYNEEMFIQDIL